jgi:hypothetical protein
MNNEQQQINKEEEVEVELKEYNGVMLPRFKNGRELISIIPFPNAEIIKQIEENDKRRWGYIKEYLNNEFGDSNSVKMEDIYEFAYEFDELYRPGIDVDMKKKECRDYRLHEHIQRKFYPELFKDEEEEEEEEEKCWTCGDTDVKHKTYRDALAEYELTCDKCHRIEYPEEYEEEEVEEKCEICDRNAYHKNDWHCSQGKTRGEEEDPMVCGNVVNGVATIGCGGVCYRSEQPKSWEYGYWSYCKDCQGEEEE